MYTNKTSCGKILTYLLYILQAKPNFEQRIHIVNMLLVEHNRNKNTAAQ